MLKRKEPELDPKEQFKRFAETARQLGDYLLSADVQGAWDVNKHEIYTVEDLQTSLLTLLDAANMRFYFRYYMQPLRIDQLMVRQTEHSVD